MEEVRPLTTSVAGHLKLSYKKCSQSPKKEKEMSRVPYTSMMGSCMYAMVCTRADLAYVVSTVSRFMSIQESNMGKQLSGCYDICEGLRD